MTGRATNGSRKQGRWKQTLVRCLLFAVGVILTLLGVILVICSLALMFDGDVGMAGLLTMLPFTIASFVGGIFIIMAQVTGGRANRLRETSQTSDQVITPPAPAGIIELEDEPQPEPASQSEAAEQPVAEEQASPTEDVAHLVSRSSDLFATLRDLVRHATGADDDKRHLASMLEAAGVMTWPDAPACEGGRLSRNGHFWIRLATDELTDEQYDTLVAAEAALSINQDLPELRTLPLESAEAQQAVLQTMRALGEQHIEQPKLTEEGLRVAYGTSDMAASTGEWVIRSIICNAAESLRAPLRVVYDLRSNSADGLVVLDLEIPRPHCMAIFTPDPVQQAGIARAYGLRLSAALASCAFQASAAVTRVVANCHERGNDDTLLSLDLSRDSIEELLAIAASSTIETDFPHADYIRASCTQEWLAPVKPFIETDDPRTQPAASHCFPELDRRPSSEAVARSCGAQRICDLGINENAVRIDAWNGVRGKLGSSTEQAVAALVEVRNATPDITVAEACNRTAQALVQGDVDLDDLGALATLFVDGSALDRAVRKATQLLDDTEGNANPQQAIQLLEAALAPIDDMGVYLDDQDSVYRYFGSVSERINHNLKVDEGGREIRLVPDAYFNAHSNASIALGLLGKHEQALAHADVCLRLAPTSTFATLRKVRILEAQSRIYEAADLIIGALRHAVTPRDASICHYRLAYMQWKLGREDLAAACYQRSLTWDTEMSSQAREELEDLLSSCPDLERPTDEQADALLAREGIPLGCIRTDGEHTLAAAVACMDDGALIAARPLMAVLFGMNGDDVVMGVYRSLSTSV